MRSLVFLGKVTFALVFSCSVLFAGDLSASADSRNQSPLRSAFLDPGVWGEQPLNSQQINELLQRHFAQVLRLLDEQADTSLSAAVALLNQQYGPFDDDTANSVLQKLTVRRNWQMRTLRDYALRGRFPQNEGQSAAVPIFVDEYQTHCTVGYLMHRSGHDAGVASIMRTDNLVYVSDVTSGQLLDWIKFSGLTQSEAALIQPGYTPPKFDATLTNFTNPDFSINKDGLVVSGLSVLEYSYSADSNNLDLIYLQGVSGVNSSGSAYSDPDNFGLAIGFGPYNGDCYKCDYTPGFDNWMFLGERFGSLSGPDQGDDAVIYRIDFRVQADSGFIDQMTTGSTSFFNGNFVEDPNALRLLTEAYDSNGGLLDLGILDFDPYEYDHLVFSSTGDQNELLVTSYALNYRPDNSSTSQFSSYWHGFNVVPEPSTASILVAVGLCLVGRRRRIRS